MIIIAGVVGALAKDIIKDNKLEIPKIVDGQFCLGFIGGAIIGGITGYYVDGSVGTAFMAGFTGTALIEGLILKPASKMLKGIDEVEQIIRFVAKQEGVDPDFVVRVAKCESGLNPAAKNVNTTGSIDRGLFQWNDKYHPEITDEIAFDVYKSTEAFCKAFKEGNIGWWSASKSCWDKK